MHDPRPLASIAALALALAACAGAAPSPPPSEPSPSPAAERCLSIVAWNDLHGMLSHDEPLIDTGRVPAGGLVALSDQIEAIRATGDTVVVLDAGDMFTGPLASTMAEGAPVIEAYTIMGVDAAAIGNHDFDFGPVGNDKVTAPPGIGDEAGAAGPRGALLARMAEAKFPFLSANVHKQGGAAPGWNNHKAFTIVERGGFKVGVVGYTTQEAPTTTLRPNVADLDFATGAAASVAKAVRELRAAGASPVLLLAHASIEGDLPKEIGDGEKHTGELAGIAADLGPDKPDAIVAGHRHAWMLGRVSGIPIVSSDWHGVGLARLRFCGGSGGKDPVALRGIERRTAMAVTPPASALGAKVAAAMAPWHERVEKIAQEPIATLPRLCEPKAMGGTALADQVARASAERVADAAAPPAGVPVVGVTNIGAIRAPIGPGLVRYSDVFGVLPFESTVAACATTRAGLLRMIDNALKKDQSRDRFPLGISGARVKIKRAADRTPKRISVEIDGQPKNMKDDAPVMLAIIDFLLWGGDELLEGVTCSKSALSQTRIRDAWRKVLEREKVCDGPSKNVIVEP